MLAETTENLSGQPTTNCCLRRTQKPAMSDAPKNIVSPVMPNAALIGCTVGLGFVVSRSKYPEWLKGWNPWGARWTSSKALAYVMPAEKVTETMLKLDATDDGIRAELAPLPDMKCQHEQVRMKAATGMDYVCELCG